MRREERRRRSARGSGSTREFGGRTYTHRLEDGRNEVGGDGSPNVLDEALEEVVGSVSNCSFLVVKTTIW